MTLRSQYDNCFAFDTNIQSPPQGKQCNNNNLKYCSVGNDWSRSGSIFLWSFVGKRRYCVVFSCFSITIDRTEIWEIQHYEFTFCNLVSEKRSLSYLACAGRKDVLSYDRRERYYDTHKRFMQKIR